MTYFGLFGIPGFAKWEYTQGLSVRGSATTLAGPSRKPKGACVVPTLHPAKLKEHVQERCGQGAGPSEASEEPEKEA